MNIVIFEDNPNFVIYLKQVITDITDTTENIDFKVTLVTDDFDVLTKHAELLEKPTIFILDIMFDGRSNGFKMADFIEVNVENAIIVFITDYPEKILANTRYKLKAFNVIFKSSPKFLQELSLTIAEAARKVSEDNIVVYSDKFTTILIDAPSIYYIESLKNKDKIKIHHSKGVYVLRLTLNKILKQLPHYFIRTHNSYIVNVRNITEIGHKERYIHLNNGGACYYTARKKKELLKAIECRTRKNLLKK